MRLVADRRRWSSPGTRPTCAVGVRGHDAVAGDVLDRRQRERGARAGALVLGELRSQVDVGEHVAVEHEQALGEDALA